MTITPAERRLFDNVRLNHPDLWRAALARSGVTLEGHGLGFVATLIPALTSLGSSYIQSRNQRKQIEAQIAEARAERELVQRQLAAQEAVAAAAPPPSTTSLLPSWWPLAAAGVAGLVVAAAVAK